MKQNFSLQGIEVMVVGEASMMRAQKRVTGCSACSGFASHAFETLLSEVLGSTSATDYFLCTPAQCPSCKKPIFEATLVDFVGKPTVATPDERYFDARGEDQDVVFVDESTLLEAQHFVSGCEHCSERAEIPFDHLLDAVTGHDPTTTEYVICHAARCGCCYHDITEKTLVLAH